MGVVYAAVDPRLGRSVALKFVPEDLAKDHQALERLRGEARTASGLNHANICTIYDIDEHEGRPFIVMELLKGQTLRDHLAPGHLKIHEVVDIGIQVADALDWAHHQGVIHRDIKPANLFLIGRGQIKILDFGLAKLQPRQSTSSSAAPTTDPTAAGITLGTVAYMSPEQVTGEELDGRTDIFSFGVVLYECVTGRQPFTGKTSAVVLSAILNRAPVAPVVFNSELPLRLQEVINNCLEKDRELRYPDAAGLRADLKRIKRDLESGHSGVVRAAGSLPLEADSLTSLSRSSLPPKGTANTESLRAAIEVARGKQWSRAQATDGPGVRRRLFAAAVGVLVVIALALTTTASYFLWLRPRTSSSVTIGSPSGALIQSRLELAATSLSAKSYRAALAYSEDVLQSAPGRPEAIRIRDQARTMIARFDQAIAKANALLAAGGAEDAAEVLDTARAIDPAAPAVTELSARLVNHFKSQAEASRRGSQAPRPAPSPLASRQGQASSDAARRDAAPQSALPEQVYAPQPPPPQAPVQAVSAPPVVAPPNTSTPPAAAPPPTSDATPATAAAPLAPREPAPPASERAPLPNAASAGRGAGVPAAQANEDEESAIRRIVATYARAIETKDLALLRSIKPNLSPEEQRRIEAGFRAVSSQRVSVAIVSIERRGQGASVRLRRRDTIDGGGRQQTTESQQTMTLTRTGGEWFISEIGR